VWSGCVVPTFSAAPSARREPAFHLVRDSESYRLYVPVPATACRTERSNGIVWAVENTSLPTGQAL